MKKIVLLIVLSLLLCACGSSKTTLPYQDKIDFSWTKEELEKKVPGGEWEEFEFSGGSIYTIADDSGSSYYDISGDKITIASFTEQYDSEEESKEVFNKYLESLGDGSPGTNAYYAESYRFDLKDCKITIGRSTPESMKSVAPEEDLDKLNLDYYGVSVIYEKI